VDFRHNTPPRWTRVAAAGPGHYLLLSKEKLTEVATGATTESDNPGFTELLFSPSDQTFVLYAADRLAQYRGGHLTAWPTPPARISGTHSVNPILFPHPPA
jgi:hypothetical protein